MSANNSLTPERLRGMLGVLGFVLAFDVIGIIVAWPIYANPFFLVTAVGAIAAATTIAWFFVRVPWSRFTAMLVAVGTYVVLALPLTSPTSFSSLADAGRGWIGSISGIVLSWKQLVTIDLPVGTYQSLLVPAFLTFYVMNLLALTVAWRAPRFVWFPVVPMLLTPVFGIAFGYSEVSRQIVIGSLTLPIALGTLGGIATLALSVTFLAWGIRMNRRTSIAKTALGQSGRDEPGESFESTSALPGTLRTARGRAQRIRRLSMAIGVFAVTGLLVGGIVTVVGVPGSRDVLRSAVDPDVAIRQEISPLSSYRMFFTDTQLLTSPMFTVDSESEAPPNVRLAVLPYFNGEIFTVMPADGGSDIAASFAKVAADLPSPSGSGDFYTSTITIQNPNATGEQPIWLPVVGAAKSFTFEGDNARELTDAFFANRITGAAVVVDASGNGANILTQGSRYKVSTYADSGLVEADALNNPGAGTIDSRFIPEKLVEWCSSQTGAGATCYEGMSGAEFASLVAHLRARGYLSHELLEPQAPDGATTWTTTLASQGYAFAPSLAGHSTRHIDDLFAKLLDRQNAVGVDQPDSNLVAAVGDDEQFAAATALLANHVGFPARVVVGYRLSDPPAESGAYTIPACDAGECRGENLAAWVEIQGTDGKWASLDVTPQFVNPISPLSQGRQDPKNETQVVDQNATVIPPSQANPSSADGNAENQSSGVSLTWLWDLLRAIFLTLLIIAAILSPFALIIGAKLRRRHRRRNVPDPTRAVVGAWDELVDELVDVGYAMPGKQTRVQLASAYSVPAIDELASLTDEAVFGPNEPRDAAVIESWEIVERERVLRRAELTMWERVRLELSVRSFLRYLTPQSQFSFREAASSLTGAVANVETGRITGFLRFLGREAVSLSRQGAHWVATQFRTRVRRKQTKQD
jgi:hypothetical protein